ncbi:ABC transporter permease [Clostridiisalibacter paucivorans]|uniref:ABC transporter permease n=1 Tax=Clostridiisalibacter paucivorans TaxID=408753 RepID=UPI00047E6995|nr:ABC transporter permease subunit [Clostridiisalibacter paucivorans]
MKSNKRAYGVLWIVLIIVIWQLIWKMDMVSPLIFPSIWKILESLYINIVSGEIIDMTIFSIGLIIEGMIISLVFAVILSILSIKYTICETLLDIIITIAHPLPGVALLPLIILWIGIGKSAIIFIIVHSVLWPMVINITTGFKSIPEIYIKIAKNYNINRYNRIKHVFIPASFPYFIGGIKIGWARAWRALISAEMIFGAVGGSGGIGWYILKKRTFFDTAGIFSGIVVIVAIGVLVEYFIIRKIEDVTRKKWGITI